MEKKNKRQVLTNSKVLMYIFSDIDLVNKLMLTLAFPNARDYINTTWKTSCVRQNHLLRVTKSGDLMPCPFAYIHVTFESSCTIQVRRNFHALCLSLSRCEKWKNLNFTF